nr:MAG TPA: hypothetical protein [Caudoviricetes sp.]
MLFGVPSVVSRVSLTKTNSFGEIMKKSPQERRMRVNMIQSKGSPVTLCHVNA